MDEKDIPTAAAMRAAATGIASERAQQTLKRIVDAIHAAAVRGVCSVTVECGSDPGVEAALRAKGYTVNWMSYQRDGSFYEVRW